MTASPDLEQGGVHARPEAARTLRRSSNRVFAGVCGGIAEYYRADATAVRLLAVVFALLTAVVPLVVLYLVAAVVMPDGAVDEVPDGGARAQSGAARGQGALIFGVVLVALGLMGLANEIFYVDWDALWPFALIGLGGLLVLSARR